LTTSFPVRPTPNLSGGFETPLQLNQNEFERQQSATNFRFKQTSCSIIAQPLSKNLVVKKISGLDNFWGKYRQFSEPTQRENQLFTKQPSMVTILLNLLIYHRRETTRYQRKEMSNTSNCTATKDRLDISGADVPFRR
jgi:hypothetical protein